MDETDAKQILNFVEMLLRFIYEFPSLVQNNSDKNKDSEENKEGKNE